MSWSVIQKNSFRICKVKVTARAYIIEIWLFLLYLLNFWSVCKQIWFTLMVHHHKFECPVKKWIAVFKVRVTVKAWSVHECLFWWYLLNHSTFCNQIWYGGVLSWVGVSCRKIGLLFSRSRSQHGLILSEYDCFYDIFWTADPFSIKHGLMVLSHMPECCVRKKKDYCIQGQDTVKLECRWMFIQTVSSGLLNLL